MQQVINWIIHEFQNTGEQLYFFQFGSCPVCNIPTFSYRGLDYTYSNTVLNVVFNSDLNSDFSQMISSLSPARMAVFLPLSRAYT